MAQGERDGPRLAVAVRGAGLLVRGAVVEGEPAGPPGGLPALGEVEVRLSRSGGLGFGAGVALAGAGAPSGGLLVSPTVAVHGRIPARGQLSAAARAGGGWRLDLGDNWQGPIAGVQLGGAWRFTPRLAVELTSRGTHAWLFGVEQGGGRAWQLDTGAAVVFGG